MPLLGMLGILIAGMTSCAHREPKPVMLEEANVLPLVLDDAYEFRKARLFLNDPRSYEFTRSEPMAFHRRYLNWGAIDNYDFDERTGNYMDFYWRTSKRSDVTCRLEYRQANLGNTVLAQEIHYPNARGSYKSSFRVTGDDFIENGRVTAWRALLIVDGKIVALKQSFMWK